MALVNCPNCEKRVSDKASVCPGCGNGMSHQETELQKVLITCEDCGTEYKQGVDACPDCGCPVPKLELQENPQKVEVTGVNISQTSKKKLKILGIIAAIVAVFVIIAGIGIAQISKQKAEAAAKAEAETAAKAEAEAATYAKTYFENMDTACFTIQMGTTQVENVGNLIKSVWYNAIYKERDTETDSYTITEYGWWVDDFNEALGNLFSDSTFINDISLIKDKKETINAIMKELKNPPDEYEDAYSALKDYYDAYIDLTNFATKPTGSLQTFSTNFSSAVTETANAYDKMELYLD